MEGSGYSDAASERYELVLDLLRRDVPPPARVVELGASPGQQSLGLRQAGYEVTAVDIGEESDAWEGVAKGSMAAAFNAKGVELVLWNLEQIPYPLENESFDAVVMTEVFEHLRDYPVKSLEEVRRILRPGGRLYLTTPNAAYVGNRLRLAIGRNPATPLHDWMFGVPFARHAREYTFGEMRHLLDHAGLQTTEMLGRHLNTRSGGRSSRLERLGKRALNRLATARPTLGPALIAVAQRPA